MEDIYVLNDHIKRIYIYISLVVSFYLKLSTNRKTDNSHSMMGMSHDNIKLCVFSPAFPFSRVLILISFGIRSIADLGFLTRLEFQQSLIGFFYRRHSDFTANR